MFAYNDHSFNKIILKLEKTKTVVFEYSQASLKTQFRWNLYTYICEAEPKLFSMKITAVMYES